MGRRACSPPAAWPSARCALPAAAQVEIGALVAWLAGLGALAGAASPPPRSYSSPGTTSAGTTAAGLAASAVLAVVPAVLARRRTAQGGRP